MTNNLSQMALKPCPFCGGKAELEDLGDPDDFFVNCTNPRCGIQQIARFRPAEAIAAWNTRTSPPADDVAPLRPSKECVEKIGQMEQANAAGWASVRDLPLGSPAPADDVVEALERAALAAGYEREDAFTLRKRSFGAKRAAISAMPRTSPELVEAARKALPIVEADLASAKEYADADWIGLSQEAFDALEAALRNAEQPEPRTSEGWQDISSAPKDGRYILAAKFTGEALGWVKHSRWITAEEIAEIENSDPDDFEPGWTDGNDDSEPCYPTHWMPLTRPEPTACSCMDVFGEDPRCPIHGAGTAWAADNPEPAPEPQP